MESPDSLPSVQCNIDANGQQLKLIAMDFDPSSSSFLVDSERVNIDWISGDLRVAGWVGPFTAVRRVTDPKADRPDLSVISSPNSRKQGQSPSLQVWDLRPSRVAHPTTSASSNTHLPTTPTPYHLNLAIFGIALHRTDNTANYSINSKILDNKNNMQSVKIRLVLDNINYFENKGIVNEKYLIYDISLILCVPQFIKNNYSNVNANVSELKQRKYKVIEVIIDTKNLGAFPQILENKSRCYKKTVDNVCDSNLIIKCILINQIFGRMPDDSIPVIKNAITVQGIVYGHPHSHSFNPNLMYRRVAVYPLSMNKSDYAFIDKTRIISIHSVFIESDSVSKKSICQNTNKNTTSRLSETAKGEVEDFPVNENKNSNMIYKSLADSQTDNKVKEEKIIARDSHLPIDIEDDSNGKVPLTKFKNGEPTFKSLLRLCEEAPAKISRLLGYEKTGKFGGWNTPKILRLIGGGESSLNAASGWGSPPNTNTNNGGANNWSGNASSGNQSGSGNNIQQQWANTNQRPPGSQPDGNSNSNKVNNVTSGGNTNNSVAPPTGPSGNWTNTGPNSNMPASSQSNNSSQVIIPPVSASSGGSNSPSASTAPGTVIPANSTGTSTGTSAPTATAKAQLEQLNTMREALFSQDGWGGQHVNQDTTWDVPTSPEPGVKIDQQGGPPVWKPNINNGTDLWEANLRNGGQPPPQPVVKTPWGHTPTSNIGGTWGEDDDTPESSNVWTGPPTGPPPWGGPPQQQPPPWTAGGKKDDWGGWGEPHRSDIHRPEMHARDLRPPAPDPRDMRVIMGIDGRGDIRGDPHGISGRLNGSGDMWGQHHMPHMQAPPNKMMPTNVGNGVNQWGAQGPKDMPIPKAVSGWEEPSPPAARRNMPNFDDGTSLWGQQRTGVGPWKDMPGGGMGRGAMQCPPVMPPNRMPGVAPNQIKPDGMWGHPHRNGSWEDSLSHPTNWEKESGNSWNEGPMNQAAWMGSKTKPMGAPGGSWDADIGDWRGGPKPQTVSASAKLIPKDMIWNSKQFRALVDMGYKKDDVELALRSRDMNFEEAAELLSQNRGSGGIDTWRRHEEHPVGPHYDHQQQYSAPPRPQHPSFPPQQPPSVPFPPPGQGLASIGNMSPAVVQKILGQPASQQPPAFNQQNNQSGASNQPSTAQLRTLVQQIQMAVSAGYLNHQILNQPLAPQTLVLLNQLLQQIKALQQLAVQHNLMHGSLNSKGNNVGMQLTVQITKAKQQITNLQNQIAAQQAIYVKQQNNTGSSSATAGGDFFNKPHESLTQLQNNFNDLTLSKDAPSTYSSSGGQQSRLNQWKLPSLDKEEGSEFSRAPGTTTKTTTSPQLNPLPLQSDSNTWSAGRTVSDGWPSSENTDLPDGKEPWPSTQPPQASTYTDLVAEFEPGKPWKGNQMKSIEDDPAITPGSVVRSPLSLPAIKDSDIFGSGNQGKASPTTPSERSLSSSTWSYPQSTPSSSTSNSFNIAKGSCSKPWGDAPTTGASDLWGSGPSMTKSRGQLPATSTTKSSSSWGGGASQPQRPASYSQQPNWQQSTWLLLKNLTAQIDGSTLKTLCMQHGPLQSFHLYLNQGIALSKYSSRDEASKAQSALNNCVLGNTTIFAESPGEADVNMILQHLGQGAGSGQWRGTGSKGAGGPTTSDTWGFSLWDSQLEQRATPSLASFLPNDLLGGESM